MAMPASRTRATWASSSRSTSAGTIRPFAQAAMNSWPRGRKLPPSGVSSDGTLSAAPTGPAAAQRQVDADAPGWAPRPASPGARGRSGVLPSSEVLVTIPSRWARRIPREMAGRHAEIVGVDDQPYLSGAHDGRIMPSFPRSRPS